MRIIAGKARGLKLITPKNLEIRPTSDRIKESVFNIIQSSIYDSIIVDIFAGTGNLGIEALSRNAKKVYFIDRNKDSIEIIEQNLAKANFTSQAEVICGDAITGINRLIEKDVQADVIFMDPPYKKGLGVMALEHIANKKLLNSSGIIVVEHDKIENMPEETGVIILFRRKDYGNTSVSFYKQKEEIK